MEGAIVVALKGIIFWNDTILIIKRSQTDTVGAGTWEPPGGELDFGERPEEALIREIKEEVGLDTTKDCILYALSFMSSPSRQVIVIAYRCIANEGSVTLSHEHSDFLWALRTTS